MKTVLITGSSRGIGLGLTRQYLLRGDRVVAACRRPEAAGDLRRLRDEHGDRLIFEPLDVAVPASIDDAAARVRGRVDSLDVLLNNAGVYAPDERGLDGLDPDDAAYVYRVNVIGPMLLTRALRPILARGAVVATLTSGSGLLRDGPAEAGTQISYGATKAAMHRTIPHVAADLQAAGVVVIGIAPGFVRTDMTGGADAPEETIAVQTSAAGIVATLDARSIGDTGRFFAYDGSRCDWAA